MPRNFAVYGPDVPGLLRGITRSGRRQMRIILGTHLQPLRALRAPVEHIALVELELARYGGDPSRPEG